MSVRPTEAEGFWNPAPPTTEDRPDPAIYTVTVFTQLREKPTENGHTYWTRDSRVWAWYPTFEEACEVVAENVSDLQECLYELALIERVPAGLFVMPRREWWFRWNLAEERWESCAKPDDYARTLGFSMG